MSFEKLASEYNDKRVTEIKNRVIVDFQYRSPLISDKTQI